MMSICGSCCGLTASLISRGEQCCQAADSRIHMQKSRGRYPPRGPAQGWSILDLAMFSQRLQQRAYPGVLGLILSRGGSSVKQFKPDAQSCPKPHVGGNWLASRRFKRVSDSIGKYWHEHYPLAEPLRLSLCGLACGGEASDSPWRSGPLGFKCRRFVL